MIPVGFATLIRTVLTLVIIFSIIPLLLMLMFADSPKDPETERGAKRYILSSVIFYIILISDGRTVLGFKFWDMFIPENDISERPFLYLILIVALIIACNQVVRNTEYAIQFIKEVEQSLLDKANKQ